MLSKLLSDMGRQLKVDKQGRATFGMDFAKKQNWFLHYDLARENSFVLTSGYLPGEGLVRAHEKALNFDVKGRCIIPAKLRNRVNGALFLNRSGHGLILFDETFTV